MKSKGHQRQGRPSNTAVFRKQEQEFETFMWLSTVQLHAQLSILHHLDSSQPLTAWWWLVSRTGERPGENLPFLSLGCTDLCDAGSGKQENYHSRLAQLPKTSPAPGHHLKGCELLRKLIQIFLPAFLALLQEVHDKHRGERKIFPLLGQISSFGL